MSADVLPRPELKAGGPDLWIDEAIWGHRLYDEQTPWMAFLEMLGVLHASAASDGPGPFRERPNYGGLSYRPARHLELRNILFNSPFIDDIARRPLDDRARWELWRTRMQEAKALGEKPDFSYVQRVFSQGDDASGSFENFAEVVRLLRSTSIEGDSNKRWTSKFVFPYGPDCLYTDLGLREKGAVGIDRRFFARTGELVYLMLARSGRGPALYDALRPLVLDPSARWNRLVKRLHPASAPPSDEAGLAIGYLPYARHLDFSAFAGDLLAVLGARLPGYDALPHLVDLIGLHLVLYILRRGAEWTPEDGPVRLVLEIIAPKRTTVRDLAAQSFRDNGARSAKAVDAYIRRTAERSPEWRAACAITDRDERAEALRHARDALFGVRESDDEPPQPDPDAMLTALRDAARRRHIQHLGEAHASYAQAIGLASRRGTRRVRYAPSDQLLKSLVLAVVSERMEFQQFLEELWRRYGMVIGPGQAGELVKDGRSDRSAFKENADRLEKRLESLGLLNRLSDACAFVENPSRGSR